MTRKERRYILTLSCPDQVGVVAAVSGFLSQHGGWILEASHHADQETGLFFMRQEILASSLPFDAKGFEEQFETLATQWNMDWKLHDTDEPKRVVLLCSKHEHCIVDLLHRHRIGEINANIVAVISNHPDMQSYVDWHGLPYHHIPVPKGDAETKAPAFEQMLELCNSLEANTLILARYMQIMPPFVCEAYKNRLINIHHSFLPSFIGGKPYHQAYDRGVKLIGATCHYVTPDLDAGPIIEQDTIRVSHADSPEDMVRLGRDVERRVLAHGVRLHLEDRILVQGNKTVVFS